METGDVCHLCLNPSESIDLASQLPLADASDGRITGESSDGVLAQGDENRLATEPCRRKRRFAAGVPTSDHDHFCIYISHAEFSLWQNNPSRRSK